MQEPEKIDPRELSPLALAFVGDSVLELLVRQRLVEHHRLSAGRLNAEKVKYVSARAQFREEQLLEPLFTEDELAVFKRGRNASKASVAKHASPEEYRASTGFECLLGWLYLNGQLARVHELFETLWQSFDPNEEISNAKARCFPHWKTVQGKAVGFACWHCGPQMPYASAAVAGGSCWCSSWHPRRRHPWCTGWGACARWWRCWWSVAAGAVGGLVAFCSGSDSCSSCCGFPWCGCSFRSLLVGRGPPSQSIVWPQPGGFMHPMGGKNRSWDAYGIF